MAPVSVITTVLNEQKEIERFVSSLLEQRPPAAEIVIVDGGSTDGTWEYLQAASLRHPTLVAVRDESCNRSRSAGPISRGRNIAIRTATSDLIACADAGCTYDPEWLARLTAPILGGDADYCLGGSCLHPTDRTLWDIASAPFVGIQLAVDGKRKSNTARSMAFRKQVWQRAGGFPETAFLGEDTLFDRAARKVASPAFPRLAKAYYRSNHSFRSAMEQIARYSIGFGILGILRARLFRNLTRCIVQVLALALLPWTPLALLLVLVVEIYFAFRLDWKDFVRIATPSLGFARLFFSLAVPWVVAWNQIKSTITKPAQLNRQNFSGAKAHESVR